MSGAASVVSTPSTRSRRGVDAADAGATHHTVAINTGPAAGKMNEPTSRKRLHP